MCGVCGVFEYRHGRPVDPEQLQRMNDALVHRGPDDEGSVVKPGVGLGNRRLSIIDVAGSRQPIANEDETCWIVLNGEIWNYRALQDHVRARGHRLRTDGDTEVILHLYEEYGADCVKHLDGMFAFILHDARDPARPRILAARDRMGKKPFYYADVDGALVMGSEVKPVLLDPRVSRTLDPEALHHYLTLLMVPAPLSIFKDVRKLLPGHILSCDREGPRVRPYWSYTDHVRVEPASVPDAAGEVRRLLFAAVEKRLVAEVPLGAFLSGGLDSSAVVAVMSRLQGTPVRTFSIGFEGPETHNELPHARAVAKHLGTEHHEFLVRPDIVELLPEIVKYADEPFAVSSAIPTYLIARAARERVTVVLTGDGGDETFGGYESYLYERWAQAYRHLPRSLDTVIIAGLGLVGGRVDVGAGRVRSRISRFVGTARRSVVERRIGWAGGMSEVSKRALLAAPIAGLSTPVFLDRLLAGTPPGIPPDQVLNVLDNLMWLPDEMLTKVDRMTMAASVEARCPLLDQDLVEFTARLPMSQRIPGMHPRNLKHLLRDAVADLLPFEQLPFRKWGFNVPLDNWFRGDARAYLESRISPERVARRGVFDPSEVARLLARHQSGEVNASNTLFALLVFDVWAERMLG